MDRSLSDANTATWNAVVPTQGIKSSPYHALQCPLPGRGKNHEQRATFKQIPFFASRFFSRSRASLVSG